MTIRLLLVPSLVTFSHMASCYDDLISYQALLRSRHTV